jgi:hypothetical protein
VAEAWASDNVVSVRADDLGRYELAGVALSASPRAIQAVSPDGRRQGSTNVVLTVPGQVVQGADIEVSGLGAVVFQVVNPQGEPVAGASVGLQGNCMHPCGCRFANTDSQGLARFNDVPFGPLGARAVVPGPTGRWDSATGTAVVNSEDIAGGGVIRVEGFGTVGGIVRNPNGTPAHGASVHVTKLRFVSGGGVCSLQQYGEVAVTDQAGRFESDNAHVGSVSVRASSVAFPKEVHGSGSIAADSGRAEFALQLIDTTAGVLSGRVLLPDGVTGVGAGVEVTATGSMPPITITTDAQGNYAFAPILPRGYYQVEREASRRSTSGCRVRRRRRTTFASRRVETSTSASLTETICPWKTP